MLQVIKAIGDRLFDILVGAAVLYVANLLLDPAPIGAALAWSFGLLLFWLRGSHSLWHASAGVLTGAVLAAAPCPSKARSFTCCWIRQ